MEPNDKKAFKEKSKQLDERVKRYRDYMEETWIEVDAKEVLNKNTLTDAIDGMEEDNKYIPYKDDVEIIIKNALKTQQSLIRNKIEHQLVARLYELKMSIRRLYRKIFFTFTIGMIGFISNIVLHHYEVDLFAVREMLNIVSWIFLWTTIEKFIFDRHELLYKKNLMERMYFGKYSFDESEMS
ncbi:MAG: hypothetical protein M0Q00_02630 [Acholeplasmataceae bacterium]|jgi:hypothetical protein|nr:hypothetical protein [Acholeplasmataceae bacterium]MDY0316166.1 hypothetical protein [Acholeplasmatales bacterium]